jgi:segregation and condensation protein A
MADYKVQLEVFEGPLDLLLYLIKKEEVDIYDVNLTRLANQFVEYVESMRRLDLEIAGEFLVMAATLLYIKSRELLPVDQQAVVEGEDDTLDPRWELIRQLVEYKKFKDMATRFQALETQQELVYRRTPGKMEFPTEDKAPAKPGVSLLDLIQAVSTFLKRFDREAGAQEILEEKWSVSEKIGSLSQLVGNRKSVRFSELFSTATSRAEVIVTFLALLELVRLRRISVAQNEAFGEIEIAQAEAAAAESSAVSTSGTQAAAGTEPKDIHGP